MVEMVESDGSHPLSSVSSLRVLLCVSETYV